MSCPCTFEEKIQINCILEIVSIVRSGDLAGKIPDLLTHSGCVMGCLGAFLKRAKEPDSFAGRPMPDSVEECCAALVAECGTGDGSVAINPLVLALFQQLIKLLIEKYL